MKLDADVATSTALQYLSTAGYRGEWIKAHRCEYDDKLHTWSVIVDVGAMRYDFRKVLVDDDSGKVVGMDKVEQG